jgi:hypothetical protein
MRRRRTRWRRSGCRRDKGDGSTSEGGRGRRRRGVDLCFGSYVFQNFYEIVSAI